MSWMTSRATLKMTETELTRRHSVRTVTHINRDVVGNREGSAGGVRWLGEGGASTPASVCLLAITRSHSGFVSHSSAHDVVAWHLCSQRLRACNNQYFSVRAVKMFGFKIGSDFSMFFESFWTVCVGLAMCLILPAPLRPASPLPADAPLRTSSTACPIVCVFSAHRDCANSS